MDATGMCPWPGRWAAQGREPHGCGDRAYRDVLAAAPVQPIYPSLLMNCFAPTHEGLRRWLETYACTGRCPRTAITSPIPASNDTAEVPP
ncbi:hypothetical protein BN1263520006 [Stenotrophomonas indicatrix]|nr:hypothetical protein BN1263520006 [Stenotrophomonas indicatrix]